MRAPLHSVPTFTEAVGIAESRFKLLFDDPESLRAIIAAGLSFGIPKDNIEHKIKLIESGFFSEELFEAMICGGASFKTGPVIYMWERLILNNIVSKVFTGNYKYHCEHLIDTPILLSHLKANTFRNLFFTPSALVSRYAGALVAIDIQRNGDDYRGSGFLVKQDEDGPVWLITCRHNVDIDAGISIIRATTSNGKCISIGNVFMSDEYDLAAIAISSQVTGPIFHLFANIEVFEEVYTLGFPNVPGARPDLLGHRGELNGIVDLYLQKHQALIISNLVSPGSSGCPVLRKEGLCVGMTVNWLEGEWDNEKARFAAALPANLINGFINLVSLKLQRQS